MNLAAFTTSAQASYEYWTDIIQDFYYEYNVDRLHIYKNDPNPERAKYEALRDNIKKAKQKRLHLKVAEDDRPQSDNV